MRTKSSEFSLENHVRNVQNHNGFMIYQKGRNTAEFMGQVVTGEPGDYFYMDSGGYLRGGFISIEEIKTHIDNYGKGKVKINLGVF